MAEEALAELIAPHAGSVKDSKGTAQKVNRAAPNAPSVVYDGVIVLGGKSAAELAKSGMAVHFVNEAYKHGKPIAFLGEGEAVFEASDIPEADDKEGVVTGENNAIPRFIEAMKQHRFPRRSIKTIRS
jgi:catalase